MSRGLEEKVDEELFDSDGDLTIYNGVPFSGIGYDPFPNGSIEYETSYKDGLPHGYKRKWYYSGQMEYEVACDSGLKHGKEIHWYPNGKTKEELNFEYGIKISSKTWSEEGELLESYQIDPESESSRILENHRRQS